MHTHPRGMCTQEKTSYDELRNVGGVRGVHSCILTLCECGTRSAALPTTPETPRVWCDRPTLLPINNPITTSSQRSFNAPFTLIEMSLAHPNSRYAEMSWTARSNQIAIQALKSEVLKQINYLLAKNITARSN